MANLTDKETNNRINAAKLEATKKIPNATKTANNVRNSLSGKKQDIAKGKLSTLTSVEQKKVHAPQKATLGTAVKNTTDQIRNTDKGRKSSGGGRGGRQ